MELATHQQFKVIGPASPQAIITSMTLSPDGRWVAYSSTESGTPQVYVVPFQGGSGKWQISQTRGDFVKWSRDGKEIFFLNGDGNFYSADVTIGKEFSVGKTNLLFRVNNAAASGELFDPGTSGQRFIVNTSAQNVSTPLTLVT